VPLAAYRLFAADDPLSRLVLEPVLAGVASRRPLRIGESVGVTVAAAATGTSRSAISRRFVAQTRTALGGHLDRRGPVVSGEGVPAACTATASFSLVSRIRASMPRNPPRTLQRARSGLSPPRRRADRSEDSRGPACGDRLADAARNQLAQHRVQPTDHLGAGAAQAAGLVALTYGLIQAGQHGWSDTGTLALMAVGVAILAGFSGVGFEPTQAEPTVLQTAAIPALNCCYAPGGRTSPSIRRLGAPGQGQRIGAVRAGHGKHGEQFGPQRCQPLDLGADLGDVALQQGFGGLARACPASRTASSSRISVSRSRAAGRRG
jgi:hypothetical protein